MSGWNDHQQAIVDKVLHDAQWLIDHQLIEWYFSARPYKRPTRPPNTKPFNGDCTGTIKLVMCDWNKIPQLDGEPSGFGNTATFARAPRSYRVSLDPKNFQPLDICLYKNHSGPFSGGPHEHATMIMRKQGSLWYVFSMGGSSGPTYERYNYRSDLAMVLRFPIPAQ